MSMEEQLESLKHEVDNLQNELEALVRTHNKYYQALYSIACDSSVFTREEMIDVATEAIMGGGLL